MKMLYRNTLIFLFLFTIGLNTVNANIEDGLVSAWLFDGNLRDSVGNNNGEFMGTCQSSKPTNKPSPKPGPVDTEDGIVSTWAFENNAEDIVGDNDGELKTGEAQPVEKPAEEPADKPDKPMNNSGPTDIDDGIVSTWTFENDTDDDIEDNDGEFNGAPLKTGPVYVDGKFGRALKFDGVDDYVQIPDDESLHFPEGFTITAWINVNVGGDHAAICWKGVKIGWGANFSWRVATTNDTSMTWGRCVAGGEKYFATSDVMPGTGEWIHVAMTCLASDAPTNQRAFINGEDITDVTGQSDNLNAEPPFLVFEDIPVEIGVGRAVGGTVGNDSYFNGLIDEIGLWNRGLNENEIIEVMERGLPSSYSVDVHNKIATTWGGLKSIR